MIKQFLIYCLVALFSADAANIRPAGGMIRGGRINGGAEAGPEPEIPDPNIVFKYIAGDSLASATFSRASTDAYFDGAGILQSATSGTAVTGDFAYFPGATAPAFLSARTFRSEIAIANKCQRGKLFGTNGTTGWTKTGDAAATLTAVADSFYLGFEGLDTIVSDVTILRLDNSGGVTAAQAVASGTTGNTSIHSLSAFIRNGTGTLKLSGGAGTAFIAAGRYTRRVARNKTPSASSDTLVIEADAGQIVDFVLPQMEQLPSETSPIPNSTAGSVSRAADALSFPFTPIPEALTVYCRYFDYGSQPIAIAGQSYVFRIGNGLPALMGYETPTAFFALHHNGTSGSTAASVLADAVGDDVELRVALAGTGAVTLGVTINGGSETVASDAAAALGAGWALEVLFLGNYQGGLQGAMGVRGIVVYKGVQTRDTMRKHLLPTRIAFDGNSMTEGGNVRRNYVARTLAALPNTIEGFNFGISGQQTPAMITDAAAQIDALVRPGYSNILVCWEGSNHLCLGGVSAATAYSDLVTYCQARRAAGWEVVILTLLPRTVGGSVPAGYEADRQTVNSSIRANWDTFADALADVAADTSIGDAGDDLSAHYYDGTHQSDSGAAIVAGLVATAIQGL